MVETVPSTPADNDACPLCGSALVATNETYDLGDILRWWEQGTVRFSREVHAQYPAGNSTTLRQCPRCGFGIFKPTAVGSDRFYSDLSATAGAWYYLQDKWEYKRALADLTPGSDVLDVGCGEGFFLDLLHKQGFQPSGLELNPRAVDIATSRGLRVQSLTLANYSEHASATHDVVTMFQVLEHVSDPLGFIVAAQRCLRPGGKLIITVPSAEGILKWAGPLAVNVPPHHVSRWTTESFAAAARRIGMEVMRSEHEPFWHYGLLLNAWEWALKSRVPTRHHDTVPYNVALAAGKHTLRVPIRVLSLIARSGLKGVRGHSLYVVMQKAPD